MSRFAFFKRLFGGAEAEQERREKPRARTREGTRILVIDDSLTILAVMRKMLTQNNFVALEAPDAEKGVEIARAEKPDLIFLDIVLPGMNGFAALRILRRDPITKDIPIIMMSGNAEATEQFYAQKIGADDFMKKPFSRPELFVRIERLFGEDQVLRRRNSSSAAFGD
jgi:DNA-binding response OmpR family regulator